MVSEVDKYIKTIDLLRSVEWEHDSEVWELSAEALDGLIDNAVEAISPSPGQWIRLSVGNKRAFKCSECARRVCIMTRHCPDCGAKMEAERDE